MTSVEAAIGFVSKDLPSTIIDRAASAFKYLIGDPNITAKQREIMHVQIMQLRELSAALKADR